MRLIVSLTIAGIIGSMVIGNMIQLTAKIQATLSQIGL